MKYLQILNVIRRRQDIDKYRYGLLHSDNLQMDWYSVLLPTLLQC